MKTAILLAQLLSSFLSDRDDRRDRLTTDDAWDCYRVDGVEECRREVPDGHGTRLIVWRADDMPALAGEAISP